MADSYGKVTGFLAEKKNILYPVVNTYCIEDGKKKRKPVWKSTGLPDNVKNRRQAQSMLDRQLETYSQGHSCVDANILLPDFVNHYLESQKRELADTTYSGYQNKCKYITNYFAEVPIRKITTMNVNQFLDFLLTEGRIKENTRKGAGLQKRTVKDIKMVLRAIYAQAVEEGIVTVNPVEEATMNRKLVRRNECMKSSDETFFDYEECMQFLKLSEEHELYYLFYFTMFFGLRRSEVLGLRWSNIDLDKRLLTIASTVTIGTKINYDNSVKTKSSNRTYPITEEHYQILMELKQKEQENRDLFQSAYVDTDYVFKHADGSSYYPDYPSKAFRKLLKKDLSLPQDVRFHGLRASCVSLLVHENIDIKEIQNWVGHADITTTLKFYTKIKSGDSKKVLSDKIGSMLQINSRQ